MDTLTLTITTIQVGGTILQYSYFSVISWFPLKTVHLFELKLWKNSGYTRPTLFVGWGEGLDLCELENAPETQKCPRLLSMIVAYKMTLTITSLQFDTMQLCTPCYSNFSQFLLLSRFSYICPGSCPPPQVSIFVTWFVSHLACEQALWGALAAGWEKEGELATTSQEFEYQHQKSRYEMLICRDDISNDVNTLGTCFSMFVYICARFCFTLIVGNLTAQSMGSHRGIGGGIQIPET